jgi:transcription elongation factor Elf1
MLMARGRPFKCPYPGCGSTDTVSKGVRKTRMMGDRKIKLCKNCGRKFTPKNQKPT